MTARRAAKPVADPVRRAMVAKIQIARKELALDEETYRAILIRLTGQSSSTACTAAQLIVVLEELKAKGWKPKVVPGGKATAPAPARRAAPAADHPAAKKARALWLSLWELGVVRDPGEHALEAFAQRQLQCERLQWADQGLTYKLIEALKSMADRNGWSQDLAGVGDGLKGGAKHARQILHLKLTLIAAQLDRLKTAGLLIDGDRASADLVSLPTVEALAEEADARIRYLGRKIRDHGLVERLN